MIREEARIRAAAFELARVLARADDEALKIAIAQEIFGRGWRAALVALSGYRCAVRSTAGALTKAPALLDT